MSNKLFPTELRPFTDVYPDIEELEIIVKILNSGGNEVDEEVCSNTHFPAHGVNCGNPICKNGGLSVNTIVSAIHKIYKNKDSEYSDFIVCTGGRYRGAKRYNSCGWAFKLLLKAKYK